MTVSPQTQIKNALLEESLFVKIAAQPNSNFLSLLNIFFAKEYLMEPGLGYKADEAELPWPILHRRENLKCFLHTLTVNFLAHETGYCAWRSP